jgi:hypothetical protein
MARGEQWKSYLLGHHEFREIAVTDLFVDPAYQRDLKENAVKKYTQGFDANLFEPLTVNERKNGNSRPTYALLDGQHRVAVAQRLGIKTVTCRVLHVNAAVEAGIFVRLNKERLYLPPVEAFKAELADKNPACIEIMKCLESRGLSVGDNDTQSISAIVALKKIYSRGGYVRLSRLLDTIILSWPEYEPSRFVGNLMRGIDDFLGPPSSLDSAKVAEKLARTTPQQILAKANNRWHGHRALGHTDKSVIDCIAEQVGIVYRSSAKTVAAA